MRKANTEDFNWNLVVLENDSSNTTLQLIYKPNDDL